MADPTAEQQRRASRLAGLFTGLCEPSEYEDLIKVGLLYRSYEGAAGFLSILRLCQEKSDG